MIKNPCLATTPILCVADIGENCDFKENMKDIYSYITVGGNHSRQAFQEILEEREDLRHNRSFSYRLCAVYSPMKKELVRRLAFQHNRAAAFHHKMTTWDWVKKLEERMIYFLASLPVRSFEKLSMIYDLYSKGQTKDQNVSKSVKGISSIPDLRGSTFKPFRNLDADTVYEILNDIAGKRCKVSAADHGNYFSVFHQKCIGVLWSQAMFDLTPNMVNMNDLTTCKGFGLAILDLCGSDKVTQDVNLLAQVVLAINYNLGLVNFTVMAFCQLERCNEITTCLKADMTQVAVCGLSLRPSASCRSPTQLDNVAVGLVIGRYGQAVALSKPHGNVFMNEQDAPYMDNTAHKQVYTYQKPVSLLKDIIEVYTSPGEWVLTGPTGIGTTVIASLTTGRNCLCLNYDKYSHHHSTIRVNTVLCKLVEDNIPEEQDN
ncbi:uncharacterized protein [Dysidea avara]|uniref:uncharacterized protein n=1 Tax=Dysidea avara TaxID=196820 RepID=UPI0033341A15